MTPDERLLYLARLVEQVPPRLLVMDEWFSGDDRDANGDVTPSSDCGTAACAAGWATRCPAFHAEGLTTDEGWSPRYIDPRDPYERRYDGYDALEKFFALPDRDCRYLFSKENYTDPTPATVAARIRAFVAARTTTA
jgi:hypothetical protein